MPSFQGSRVRVCSFQWLMTFAAETGRRRWWRRRRCWHRILTWVVRIAGPTPVIDTKENNDCEDLQAAGHCVLQPTKCWSSLLLPRPLPWTSSMCVCVYKGEGGGMKGDWSAQWEGGWMWFCTCFMCVRVCVFKNMLCRYFYVHFYYVHILII